MTGPKNHSKDASGIGRFDADAVNAYLIPSKLEEAKLDDEKMNNASDEIFLDIEINDESEFITNGT